MAPLYIPAFAIRGLQLKCTPSRVVLWSSPRFIHPGTCQLDYVPRRVLFYVPGNDERKLKKIPSLGCDCAVLDLEDGVSSNRKVEARKNVVATLQELDFSSVVDVGVRINSVSSPYIEDDLLALQESPVLPQTLLLPKLDTVEEARWFAMTLKKLFEKRDLQKPFRLLAYIESAVSLLDIRELIARVNKMSCADDKQGAPYRLDGLVFGSDDFVASIGAYRSRQAEELLYARQKIVVTAKAYKLQAIDLVYIHYQDTEGLKLSADVGVKIGFTGKQVIHPSQVETVQQAFSPKPEAIEWAWDLLAAFDDYADEGKGAFVFRGKMTDAPMVLQAKNIITMSKLLNKDNDPKI